MKWTKEIEAWIRAQCPLPPKTTLADFLNRINKKFNTSFTRHALQTFLSQKKILTGLRAKQVGTLRGAALYRNKPVGAERWKDGYLLIKIAWPNVWKLKHICIYEQAHNEIVDLKNYRVIFLDGNRSNFDPENLYKLSKAELYYLNLHLPATNDPKEKLIYIALAKNRLQLLAKAKELGLLTSAGAIIPEQKILHQQKMADPAIHAKINKEQRERAKKKYDELKKDPIKYREWRDKQNAYRRQRYHDKKANKH